MAASKPCTLPDAHWLRRQVYWPSGERVYDEDEIAALRDLSAFNRVPDVEERREAGREVLRTLWPDSTTFIGKQHLIGTKKPGIVTLLQYNYVQQGFYKIVEQQRAAGQPIRIITLKARQLGQSTGIQSFHYEECDSKPNRVAFTISYDDDSSLELFQKAHKIHNNLWFPQRTRRARGNKLELSNGSLFLTATAGNLDAGRSFTIHNLHISELPMWPNAAEVLEGLLNSVSDEPDTSIFIESTAKGTANEFCTMWRDAEKGNGDFYPYFAPWYWNPQYQVPMTPSQERSFVRKMNAKDERYMKRYELTPAQMLWRERTIKTKLSNRERSFRQEFPACPEEAFLSSGSPVFNQAAIRDLEENVTRPLWRGHILLDAS